MKARLKMHQMPGDIPRREKIALLEGGTLPSSWGSSSPKAVRRRAKSFKRMVVAKERAVLKRRWQRELV